MSWLNKLGGSKIRERKKETAPHVPTSNKKKGKYPLSHPILFQLLTLSLSHLHAPWSSSQLPSFDPSPSLPAITPLWLSHSPAPFSTSSEPWIPWRAPFSPTCSWPPLTPWPRAACPRPSRRLVLRFPTNRASAASPFASSLAAYWAESGFSFTPFPRRQNLSLAREMLFRGLGAWDSERFLLGNFEVS